jgi:hypothetical protein
MTRYIVVLYLMSHSLVVFLYRLLDRLKILNGIKFRIFNYCRLFAYPVGFLIRHFSFIVHYCISSKPLKTTAYAIKVVLISCTYLRNRFANSIISCENFTRLLLSNDTLKKTSWFMWEHRIYFDFGWNKYNFRILNYF